MWRRFGVALVLVAAAIPLAARAGLGHRCHGFCGGCLRTFNSCRCANPVCGGCQLPPARCCCPPPIVQTPLVPQTTTILREQRFTTCQPVTRTVMRREARIVYQDVPVQIVERVPVTQTRLVPMQVTTLVPRPACPPAGAVLPGPVMITPMSPGPNPVIVSPTAPSPSFSPPVIGPPTTSIPTAPSLVPPSGAAPVPEPYSPAAIAPFNAASAKLSPLPEEVASAGSGGWTKVPPRHSNHSEIKLQSYQQTSVVPGNNPEHRVPSAATVWRAQGAFR